MALALIAFIDGLLALALVALGIASAHFYLLKPFAGFQLFLLGFLLGILGVIFGAIAIFVTRRPDRRPARGRAIAGTVLSLVVALPIFIVAARSSRYPEINDITTDVDTPPEFTVAVTLPANAGRDMKYDKAKYAAQQEKGYGIMAPVKERMPPAEAFERVKEVASGVPAWQVTDANPSTMTLEAVATSRLFHFQDDVIVQVRPASDGGSLIVMRSKSRDGIGDMGINHRRIRRFYDRMALARGQTDTEEMP